MTTETVLPPVAYLVKNKETTGQGALHFDASFAAGDGDLLTCALITTEQAQAYADARVREVLEQAIAAVESCRTTGTIRYGTVSDCIEAIRALLPSTPARPESE